MNLLINIDVDELQKGIDFYTAAFGLRIGRHFGDWVELVGGNAPIYLLPKAAGTPVATSASTRRTYERHWTPLHLDFVVEDLELAVRKATQAGAQLEQAPATRKYGRLALLSDPFGHGFCLIQFTGKGYDEIAR